MSYMGGVRTEEQSRRWLRENLHHWDAHGFALWVFRDLTDGAFVGRCGLRRLELMTGGEIELGYATMRQFWGQGLATEMAKGVLRAAIARQRLDSAIALIDPRNLNSRRVAQRASFRFERNITWKSGPAMLFRQHRRSP